MWAYSQMLIRFKLDFVLHGHGRSANHVAGTSDATNIRTRMMRIYYECRYLAMKKDNEKGYDIAMQFRNIF